MEGMSEATVDDEALVVRRSIEIAASVDRVWRIVTEPDQISRWLGDTELSGRGAGAVGTVSWPDRGAIPLRVEHVDPPSRITYRWCNDDALAEVAPRFDAETSTVFTFTLQERPGGTLLTVVESGFEATSDPAANLDSHRRGWNSELDELIAVAEALT